MSKGFLTADQREQLNTYPKEISNTDTGRFFTLTPADRLKVSQQRSDHNRIGFALQLCTLRYLGFIPNNLLDAPQTLLRLLAHQLGVSPQAINIYGEREQTKSDHLSQIMQYEGYRRASTTGGDIRTGIAASITRKKKLPRRSIGARRKQFPNNTQLATAYAQ